MNYKKIFDEIINGEFDSELKINMLSTLIMNNFDDENLITDFMITVGKFDKGYQGFDNELKKIYPFMSVKLHKPKMRMGKTFAIIDRNNSLVRVDNIMISNMSNINVYEIKNNIIKNEELNPSKSIYGIEFSDIKNKLDYQITITVSFV